MKKEVKTKTLNDKRKEKGNLFEMQERKNKGAVNGK